MKKTIAIVLSTLCIAMMLTACGSAKSASVTDAYYYTVAFNHMAGEYMGTNLTNELIRNESEMIALYDDGTFVVTFTSDLVGTISGDDHETGYVYPQSMYECAVLTGTYTVVGEDSVMQTKTISLDTFTKLTHNNVEESLTDANEDGITLTATAGTQLTFNTETNLISEFFEFYEGQYQAANTNYAA
jgi:hypothetical protein